MIEIYKMDVMTFTNKPSQLTKREGGITEWLFKIDPVWKGPTTFCKKAHPNELLLIPEYGLSNHILHESTSKQQLPWYLK